MADAGYGKVLAGNEEAIRASFAAFSSQPVDQDLTTGEYAGSDDLPFQTTLGGTFSVSGQGTFFGGANRTLVFEPSSEPGWAFLRRDLPGSMPIGCSVRNVWTTARNIVLCSGSPHNYMRMVEHIVALRTGLGLDNVMIRVDSGDPPLFDNSSLDMVESVERVGIVAQKAAPTYVTVKEPVTVAQENGGFLTFLPAENGSRALHVDCAVDFRTAIGQQRIRFTVNRKVFRHGSFARTNTTLWMMLFCKTIGKIFADTRHLGYNRRNILVAGPKHYYNPPRFPTNGKSLEAAWHRATLDLLAAVALIDRGRFCGRILSYKSGHTLDVVMAQELYRHELLEEVRIRP
jgi:UDP-3-O-acyl-N-acetylglucosamine deacetylase